MIQIIKNFKNNNINPILWIYFPIFIPLVFIIVKKINMDFFTIFFTSENGIIENGTFLILLLAIIISISSLKIIKKNYRIKKLFFFIILFTLSLIYFAGEEINGANIGFIGMHHYFLRFIMNNISEIHQKQIFTI